MVRPLAYGIGVSKNETEAVKWYRAAAEAGNSDGMHDLAYMMEYGKGTPMDLTQALRWYRAERAANEYVGQVYVNDVLAKIESQQQVTATAQAQAQTRARLSAPNPQTSARTSSRNTARQGPKHSH